MSITREDMLNSINERIQYYDYTRKEATVSVLRIAAEALDDSSPMAQLLVMFFNALEDGDLD